MNYFSRPTRLINILVVTLLVFLAACKNDASVFEASVYSNQCDTAEISIDVSKNVISIDETISFTAKCISDTKDLDLTDYVTWSISNSAVASINNKGLLTGLAHDDVTINAKISDLAASTDLHVTDADLVIGITRTNTSQNNFDIYACDMMKLIATATYPDDEHTGLEADITKEVTWTATTTAGDPLTAGTAQFSNDADENGLLLTTKEAVINITAEKGTDTKTDPVTINIIDGSATITSITPTNKTLTDTIPTENFKANATIKGTDVVVTRTAFWKSSDTTVATISNAQGSQGLATAIDAGSTNITATCNGVISTPVATLTVTSTTELINITIDYELADVENKDSTEATIYLRSDEPILQLTATAHFSNGSETDITEDSSWTVNNITNASPVPVKVNDTDGNKGQVTVSDNGTVNIVISYTPAGSTDTADTKEALISIVGSVP